MTISILGCGWLGIPLAEALLNNNHKVKGSTTSKTKISTLKEKGIESYIIKLDPELQCDDCSSFWDSDILVLNIPPGRKRDNVIEFHTTQIQSVIGGLRTSNVDHIVFISSTSVYPELPGVVEEKDAVEEKARKNSGKALLRVESLLQKEEFHSTIIRFGGLYGYDRHPVKYLSGKTELERGNAPVNLIHQDDCIRIIKQIIEEEIKDEVFNAVSDGHPPRKMYYQAAAKTMGLEPPTFKKDSEKNYKVVSNRKLKKKLNYQFMYPNPMNFEGNN